MNQRLANAHNSMTPSRTLMQSIGAALGDKLGRCVSCMRLSAGLALVFGVLLALALIADAGRLPVLAAAIPAAAFTFWLLAHGVAYVGRGAARAEGCRSCAEKTKARLRAVRRRRRWGWLLPKRTAATQRRKRGCTGCGDRSLESIYDADTILPPADERLRDIVERSPEFRSLVSRLATPVPVDTWTAQMRSHFLYQLQPDADGAQANALFIARWEDDDPISAVIVLADPDGGEPRVIDLRSPKEMETGQT